MSNQIGIQCSACGSIDTSVIDSRQTNRKGIPVVRRRRVCSACLNRVTSYEIRADKMDEITSDARELITTFKRVVELSRKMTSPS